MVYAALKSPDEPMEDPTFTIMKKNFDGDNESMQWILSGKGIPRLSYSLPGMRTDSTGTVIYAHPDDLDDHVSHRNTRDRFDSKLVFHIPQDFPRDAYDFWFQTSEKYQTYPPERGDIPYFSGIPIEKTFHGALKAAIYSKNGHKLTIYIPGENHPGDALFFFAMKKNALEKYASNPEYETRWINQDINPDTGEVINSGTPVQVLSKLSGWQYPRLIVGRLKGDGENFHISKRILSPNNSNDSLGPGGIVSWIKIIHGRNN